MRCIKLFVLCALLLWDASAFAAGSLETPATSGSGLPSGGSVDDCLRNTAPGTGAWSACPGAAGGDSVSVDGAAVVDPNFDSGGDIDFVNTSNTITANVKANSVALGTDTTGNYAAGDAEGGAATSGDSATSFFSTGTIEDARLPSSMADKTITGSLNIPNSTSLPATCTVGNIYMDTNATSGQRLYLCESTDTWALQGDGGGGSGDVATDTIWDAAGDLAVGTGANTAGRLAVGTTGQLLHVSGGTPAWTSAIAGLTSLSFGSDPGDAGPIRLENNTCLNWEIATPGTDKCLKVNASDQLDFNGTINLSGSTTGSVVLNGSTSGSLTITTADATAQAVTITVAAQTSGAATLAIPDRAGSDGTFAFVAGNIGAATATTPSANDNDTSVATTAYVQTELTNYAADSKTLTNTTLNTESTGNAFTIPRRVYFPAAGCNNATAGSVWNLPTSNAPAAACITGTNTQKGVLDFDSTTDESAQVELLLPSTWTGAIDANVLWLSGTTTGSVAWCIQLISSADAETDDPAYPAQATGNCVSDAAKGSANQLNVAALTSITATGVAAGELLHIQISRDPNETSTRTDDHAADARLVGVELIYRVAE